METREEKNLYIIITGVRKKMQIKLQQQKLQKLILNK